MPALIRQGGLLFYVGIYPLSLWRAVKIVHPLPILWHTGTILADVLPVRSPRISGSWRGVPAGV